MNNENFVGPYREPLRKSDKYMRSNEIADVTKTAGNGAESITFKEAYSVVRNELKWREWRSDLERFVQVLRQHVGPHTVTADINSKGRIAQARRLLKAYDERLRKPPFDTRMRPLRPVKKRA
jgi:hypothetical protein